VTFGEPMSDHLLGLRLKARFGLPWIAHFSDPWADNRFRRYNWLANIVNRRLERDVIARADRVIFTSQEALDVVIGKYPPSWREKAAILPHSFDPTLFPPPAPAADEIVVRHVGNFYGHRTPIPLFHALKLILGREPRLLQGVRFELVGHVPLWVRKHPSLRALPAGLVQLTGQVSYLESLRLMSNSQLLLTIDGPDDLSVFLPSKLIEYLGSGAPIFGIVPPGTSAKLLARCGGLVADPRNPVEVAQALNQTLQLVRERRRSRVRTPWADRKVRSEFHVERVAAAFSELLRDVVREPRKAPAV
jgi:glycosyltransferase involved in cell wall biosynthesis